MVSLRVPLFASLIAIFAAVTVADLTIHGDSDKFDFINYGSGDVVFTVISDKPPSADVTVSSSSLYSVGPISHKSSDSSTNYTVPLSLDNGVGKDNVVISIGSESVSGTVVAAGFVIMKNGEIVTGDSKPGVSVPQSGSTTYDVKAVDKDGSPVDVSGTTIKGASSSGPYMKELDMTATTITSSKFTLAIASKRVGTGSFTVMFESSVFSYMGESFETSLKVSQETSPAPPCVVMGGEVSVSNGKVSVDMYNLMLPGSSAVSDVTISVGSQSASWNKDLSTLVNPDQKVVFDFSTNGVAIVTCDGEDAYMSGGDLKVVGGGGDTPTSSGDLAKDHVSTLGPKDGFAIYQATFRFLDSSRDTFLRSVGDALAKSVCGRMASPDACVIRAVVDGSAVVTIDGYTKEGTDPTPQLESDTEDCSIQADVGYENKCDQLVFMKGGLLAVSGGAVPASVGLATWTIVLIAGLGAFALIALIMLGLLAVYRRSAEQSESDYSSSGPLGVPDPSDLLYEQSIVRDIYGRGDFPEGGPTAEVAQQRAREADLREEFPRPPSSSGLSRSATDDASSTYSV